MRTILATIHRHDDDGLAPGRHLTLHTYMRVNISIMHWAGRLFIVWRVYTHGKQVWRRFSLHMCVWDEELLLHGTDAHKLVRTMCEKCVHALALTQIRMQNCGGTKISTVHTNGMEYCTIRAPYSCGQLRRHTVGAIRQSGAQIT